MNILDDIEYQIRRHSVFDKDEMYWVNVLWTAGSYFLRYHKDIKVFRNFPMLAFMSPEPNSGKSTALEVTRLLSRNPLARGKYSQAVLLALVDQANETGEMITTCQDEIDNVFAYGKDNADLISFYNLGYEAGTVIVRLKRFGDGLNATPAYCAKLFAGLVIARIPGPTKTRTIIINMRPKTEDKIVEEYIDEKTLKELNERITIWSEDSSVLDKLRAVDLSEASFLTNRNRQLWRPLLAIAKVTSPDWYQRALQAARYFTIDQAGEDLTHKILLGAYQIFRSGKHLDKIHSITLLEELHDLGIPRWMDQNRLSDYLSGYDPEIRTRQIKIDGINKHGYEWHNFINTFNRYISDKETEEIEKELGIKEVAAVAPIGSTPGPKERFPRETVYYPLPALPALPALPVTDVTPVTRPIRINVNGRDEILEDILNSK